MKNSISVIIPSRNRHILLRRCIQSILENTLLPKEIIIIDKSKDNFIIKDFLNRGPKITYYKIASRGISTANNFGIQMATGDIVAFTNDDCIVDKHWIASICRFFSKKKNIDLVYGQVLPAHQNNFKKVPSIRNIKKFVIISRKNFNPIDYSQYMLTSNFACKRSLFNKIGSFIPWLGASSVGNSSEDNDFCLRMINYNLRYAADPDLKTHHARQLSETAYNNLIRRYIRGWVAMWIYQSIQKTYTAKYAHRALSPLILYMSNLAKLIFSNSIPISQRLKNSKNLASTAWYYFTGALLAYLKASQYNMFSR